MIQLERQMILKTVGELKDKLKEGLFKGCIHNSEGEPLTLNTLCDSSDYWFEITNRYDRIVELLEQLVEEGE
jgi:hypothetical protein